MKALTNNDIAYAIYLSTNNKEGIHLRDALHNVTKFLARRRLLGKNREILESLQKIINQKEGIVVAKVTSAYNLGYETKTQLEHLMKKRYSAKDIIIEEALDAKLLGGMRIEVNDEVMDLSIKNRIGQLQGYLKRA